MKHGHYVFVAIAAVMLTACTQPPAKVWINLHPNNHDYAQDHFVCLKTAAEATPPAVGTAENAFGPYQFDFNAKPRDDLYMACMNAKEWSFQTPMQLPMQQLDH